MYFAMHREGCSSAGQGVRALKAMTRSRVARPSSLWSRSEARLASISADHNDCDSDADPEGRVELLLAEFKALSEWLVDRSIQAITSEH